MPSGIPEEPLETSNRHVGHDPIEALTIRVNDKHYVSKTGQSGFRDRLPDVAFVELRITEQGDETSRSLGLELCVEVPPYRRGEQWSHSSEADRPRRKVCYIRIFRPRGVSLEASIFAELGQVGRVEFASEVLDGVKNR